jgi:YYY domain-containing protein
VCSSDLLAAQVAFHLLRSGLDDAREAHARLAVFAWIVASLLFLNTWDFPIYLALAVLAWLAGHSLAAGRLGRAQWVQALCLGVGMLLGGVLAYTLFLVSFSSQAGGVLPYLFPPTRLTQYLIMFGPFVVILGGFLLTALIIENHGPGRPFSTRGLAWGWLRFAAGCALAFLGLVVLTGLALWVDGFRSGHLAASLLPYLGGESFPAVALQVLAQRLSHPWLFLLLTALLFLALAGLARALRAARANEDLAPIPASPGRLFAWLLALLGLALTFSVEFVYLRDDFGVRMNTVFKFYFQGWVLMAAASAYALVWMAAHAGQALKRWQHNLYRGLSLAVVLGGLAFPILGVFSRTEGFRAAPNLDSTVNLRRDHPDDWAVIDWLNANSDASGQVPRLLEAPGHSYNYEGRISAFTGLPTVLGWSLHEAQWRGNYDEQGRREPLIAQIYTSADPATALQLLRSLGVDFVVLGDPERAYIREQCAQANPPCDPMAAEAKFTQALPLAFQQGQTNLYAVPPVP